MKVWNQWINIWHDQRGGWQVLWCGWGYLSDRRSYYFESDFTAGSVVICLSFLYQNIFQFIHSHWSSTMATPGLCISSLMDMCLVWCMTSTWCSPREVIMTKIFSLLEETSTTNLSLPGEDLIKIWNKHNVDNTENL